MDAILLAAGLGTRLRPITNNIPKCLVPIAGKPLLYIWIEQLYKVGVRHFYINTHFFAEQVQRAIADHPLRDALTQIYEPELLGTAGTVKNILQHYTIRQQELLIAHADNLCLCDWPAFFSSIHNSEAQVAMMAFETDNPSSCGILEIDEQQKLLAFHEKVSKPPGNLANGAVYLFKPQATAIFRELEQATPDISIHVIPQLLDTIRVWPTDGYLRDIGSPDSYQQAQSDSAELNEKFGFLGN